MATRANNKLHSWLPYLLLLTGCICFCWLAWRTELFRPDSLVLSGLACTCPDFRVVQGTWKISSPILDTVEHLDKAEVYVTGVQFPKHVDGAAIYDLHVAEGEVVGVDRVSSGAPWNPVIHVHRWKYLGIGMTLGFGILKWSAILFTVAGLWLLLAGRSSY